MDVVLGEVDKPGGGLAVAPPDLGVCAELLQVLCRCLADVGVFVEGLFVNKDRRREADQDLPRLLRHGVDGVEANADNSL